MHTIYISESVIVLSMIAFVSFTYRKIILRKNIQAKNSKFRRENECNIFPIIESLRYQQLRIKILGDCYYCIIRLTLHHCHCEVIYINTILLIYSVTIQICSQPSDLVNIMILHRTWTFRRHLIG
ncbi:hypothetical protein L9F63_001572, partial [Diploptera punctata]